PEEDAREDLAHDGGLAEPVEQLARRPGEPEHHGEAGQHDDEVVGGEALHRARGAVGRESRGGDAAYRSRSRATQRLHGISRRTHSMSDGKSRSKKWENRLAEGITRRSACRSRTNRATTRPVRPSMRCASMGTSCRPAAATKSARSASSSAFERAW